MCRSICAGRRTGIASKAPFIESRGVLGEVQMSFFSSA